MSNCCQGAGICYAGPIIDPSGCLELGGTMGAPGSICSGATGTCVMPPASGGPCCSFPQLSVCTAGPGANPAGCSQAGGLPHPNGICDWSACVFP